MKHLAVRDFRNHEDRDVPMEPGAVVLTGGNGTGKTSVLEALAWCATLRSHRASAASTLVRVGADEAVVRCRVARADRDATLEVSIPRTGTGRARLNGSDLPRPRELLGVLQTVLFAPEDLALVRGEPGERRSLLDGLLVQLAPRVDGLRSDLDRVLRQRGALLRSQVGRRSPDPEVDATLEVWDAQLVRLGSELTLLRLRLVRDLAPLLAQAHEAVADSGELGIRYRSSWLPEELTQTALPDSAAVEEAFRAGLTARRREEMARGVTLVGPHRDDAPFVLADLPARTHSSHGEAWSVALSARLAAAALLRAQGDDPVLLLDDVFAELDRRRRERLAAVCARFDQVVATAAVLADVPEQLREQVVEVGPGG